MRAALCIRSLWKSYTAGVRGCSARVLVLRGLSLTVEAGERVRIVGGPGSGKTTLLQCITGLRVPDGGVIERGSAGAGESPLVLFDDDERGARSPASSSAVLIVSRFLHRRHAPPAHRVLLLLDGRLFEPDLSSGRRRVAEGWRPEGAGAR